MSQSEERIMILKMLEEGKITSEEAARLLEALDSGKKEFTGNGSARQDRQDRQSGQGWQNEQCRQDDRQDEQCCHDRQDRQGRYDKHGRYRHSYWQGNNFYDDVEKVRERVREWKRDFRKNYGQNQNDFDRMVEDFSTKAEKLGKNLASSTFGIVDKMVDFVSSFVDTNAFNIFGKYNTYEKSFEAEAAEGMDVLLEGLNGAVSVKKHEGGTILIKALVKSPANNADSLVTFSNQDGAVSVRSVKQGNISVSYEVLLPSLKFNKLALRTSNGKIYAEDSTCESFECSTRNGHIEIMGLNAGTISLSNRNGKLQLSYVTGRDIKMDTINSVIDIKHVKVGNLGAMTQNGRIMVDNIFCFDDIQSQNIVLKTTNGGIRVNMNDTGEKGYRVKASAKNGGVNLLIPEIVYGSASRRGPGGSYVEAESAGYAEKQQKVDITADTVNGFIEILR